MTRATQRLRPGGLALLAILGLMAVGAVNAQAQFNLIDPKVTSTPGLFLVLHPGKSFIEEGLGEVLDQGVFLTFTGQQEGPIRIVVPGRNLIIGCAGLDITEGKLYGQIAHAKFQLLQCTAWSLIKGPKEHEYLLGGQLPCQVNPIAGKVKFKAILHGGETFVLIEGLEGPALKLVELLGELCPLPPHTLITGSLGALIQQLNSNPQLFTFSPQIQLLLGDKLFFGGFEAYYEGSATVLLTGPGPFAHVPWGAH